MYNDGSQNISYHNGDLQVHFKNSSKKKLEGKVRPSCEGYIIFPDSINKTFEYHEYDQKIVWDNPEAEKIWIGGCCYSFLIYFT